MSVVAQQPVAVLGASSLVGSYLLEQLEGAGYEVHAFSRSPMVTDNIGVTWHTSIVSSLNDLPNLRLCVCVAPIWVLPGFFPQLAASGVRRVVALSSTSVFTKEHSSDAKERRLSQKIAGAENDFKEWAQLHGVEWVILRPTLVYGSGGDKSVSVIARFIKKFGFFPLFGAAGGQRQPVHARDVALACAKALHVQGALSMDFNLSGAECLTYRQMVERVFIALGLRPRFVELPVFMFQAAFFVLGLLPRYRHWSIGMALRMNQNQACENSRAESVLGFTPQRFILVKDDLPKD